jgi:glucuronosyltransferase
MLALLPVALNHGARILGVFPFPERSHVILHKALMLELARRGHEVTMISCYPEDEPIPNYTDIVLKKDLNISSGGFGKPLGVM